MTNRYSRCFQYLLKFLQSAKTKGPGARKSRPLTCISSAAPGHRPTKPALSKRSRKKTQKSWCLSSILCFSRLRVEGVSFGATPLTQLGEWRGPGVSDAAGETGGTLAVPVDRVPVQWADVCDAILSTCAPGDEATAAATLMHVVLTGGLWSSLLRSAAAAVATAKQQNEAERAGGERSDDEHTRGGGRVGDAVASLQDGDVQQMTTALWLSFCTTWALPGTAAAAAGAATALPHDPKNDANDGSSGGGSGPVVGSRLPAPVGWMLRANRAGTCFCCWQPWARVCVGRS
jgi:hypothetical protein